MTIWKFLLAGSLASSVLVTGMASAGPVMNNIAGNWTGSGKALVPIAGAVNVKCSMKVTGDDGDMDMRGKCRAMLFSRALELTLKSKDGSNWSGTYSGTRAGLAKLSGERDGDRLVLRIDWPKPVNGDKVAKMVLTRTGPDSFSQVVTDKVKNRMQETATFSFNRQ